MRSLVAFLPFFAHAHAHIWPGHASTAVSVESSNGPTWLGLLLWTLLLVASLGYSRDWRIRFRRRRQPLPPTNLTETGSQGLSWPLLFPLIPLASVYFVARLLWEMVRVLVYCSIDVAINTTVYAWTYGRYPALRLIQRASRQFKEVVWDTGLRWTIATVRTVDIWLYQTGFPYMLRALHYMYYGVRFAVLHMAHGLHQSLLWLIDLAIVVRYRVLRPAARVVGALWHRVQLGLASMYRLIITAGHCAVVVGQDLWADVRYLVQGLSQLAQLCHQVLLRPLGRLIVQAFVRCQQMCRLAMRFTTHGMLWLHCTALAEFRLALHSLARWCAPVYRQIYHCSRRLWPLWLRQWHRLCTIVTLYLEHPLRALGRQCATFSHQLAQQCAAVFGRLWARALLPSLAYLTQRIQVLFLLSRRYAVLGVNWAWQGILVPLIYAVQPWMALISRQAFRVLQLSCTWGSALTAWIQQGLRMSWAHLFQGTMYVAVWAHVGLLYTWSVLEHSAYPLGCHIVGVVGAWLSLAWSMWVQYGWPWAILFGRWAEYRSSQLRQWVVRQGPQWWQTIEPYGQRLQQHVSVFVDQLVQAMGNSMMEWTKDWHQGYVSASR